MSKPCELLEAALGISSSVLDTLGLYSPQLLLVFLKFVISNLQNNYLHLHWQWNIEHLVYTFDPALL